MKREISYYGYANFQLAFTNSYRNEIKSLNLLLIYLLLSFSLYLSLSHY